MFNHRNYKRVGWVIAILAMAQSTGAQQRYSGIWQKVSLIHSDSPFRDEGSCLINDFGFKDSLFGLAWVSIDQGNIYSTTDGGHSWQLDTSLGDLGAKLELNCVDVTGPDKGIILVDGITEDISPGASDGVTNGAYDSTGLYIPYLPIAEHMADTANGYRWVQAQDYHGGLADSMLFLVTHDAWQHAVPYGTDYDFSESPNQAPVGNPLNFFGGLIIDSSETWTADSNTIMHTNNAGAVWDTFMPADTHRYKSQWDDFLANPVTHEIYAVAQGGEYSGNVDFAYSSDYGTTWRLDSTFGWRLWRLAVPAPGIIWAMLSNGGIGGSVIDPTNAIISPSELSNKVAYSSDTGKTWYIDSTTFADDSLVEMHFTDARHGWIAGYANNDGHIWYYDADESIVNSNTQLGNGSANSPYLLVYPDPAQTTITITGATLANGSTLALTVFDPLGRRYFCPQENAILDIASLPSGIYFVNDGYVSGKFVKE